MKCNICNRAIQTNDVIRVLPDGYEHINCRAFQNVNERRERTNRPPLDVREEYEPEYIEEDWQAFTRKS